MYIMAKQILVSKESNDPKQFWKKNKSKQKHEKVIPISLDTPIADDKVRFVCISDTHNITAQQISKGFIPSGDILIHAGDFSNSGKVKEVLAFQKILKELSSQFRHKVVIAGNHDLTFDQKYIEKNSKNLQRRIGPDPTQKDALKSSGFKDVFEIISKDCTYLQDSLVTVAGIKIYGSPWQPKFCNWAFNLNRGEEILEKWNLIPEETDVLITHGPPVGHGDLCYPREMSGCVELLNTVQKRVKPKYHVFGHIHEDYGVTTDGETIYINASTCNLQYRHVNPPVIFDLPLPDGFSKDDISAVINCDTKQDAIS